MPKDNVPTLFIEVADQGASGFKLDGTAGTQYEQELKTPTVSWIPTDGVEVWVDEKGIRRNRVIRHIKNCESIYPLDQEKMGFKPNRMNDKIPMDNGFATIRREGSTVSTYDYLTAATYFKDNPLRPETATALYREVKVKERAVQLIDEDEYMTAAKHKVYGLRINTGSKGDYKYDENKINAYCNLLDISDETSEQKLVALLGKAITNPRAFLQIISKAENTVITEVSHALQLGLIMFEGKSAQYKDGKKVISTFEEVKANTAADKKIEALANYFQTQDAKEKYEEFKIKLDVQRENELKN